MTTKHTFPRSLATLSAIVTLAIGGALIAVPSTARAESLKVNDLDGLSFRDVVAETQDGQIVITAEVTVIGTAGKPRTGSIVFSAFTDYSDDASFMDYTDDACTVSSMSRQAATQACAEISRALRDASTTIPGPVITAPATPAEGIIMRDGGVCDPIRHMGC